MVSLESMRELGLFVYLEPIIHAHGLNLYLCILSDLFQVIPSIRWPLSPVFWSIKDRKGWSSGMMPSPTLSWWELFPTVKSSLYFSPWWPINNPMFSSHFMNLLYSRDNWRLEKLYNSNISKEEMAYPSVKSWFPHCTLRNSSKYAFSIFSIGSKPRTIVSVVMRDINHRKLLHGGSILIFSQKKNSTRKPSYNCISFINMIGFSCIWRFDSWQIRSLNKHSYNSLKRL